MHVRKRGAVRTGSRSLGNSETEFVPKQRELSEECLIFSGAPSAPKCCPHDVKRYIQRYVLF